MFKKIILLSLIACMTWCLTGCGSSTSAESKSNDALKSSSVSSESAAVSDTISQESNQESNQESVEESVEESVQESVQESVEEKSSSETAGDLYHEIGITKIYIPAGFEDESGLGDYLWISESDGDYIYVIATKRESYFELYGDSYELKDVQDILSGNLDITTEYGFEKTKEVPSIYTIDYEVGNEEEVKVNGADFIKQEGLMDFNDNEHHAKYITYYVLGENQHYKKVPTAFRIMSTCNKESTYEKMKSFAEEILNHTTWVEKTSE